MNFLFRNIKDLMIYLDDIRIANNTYKYHINPVRAVRQIVKHNKLWFNENTCQFMPASMQILCNILTDHGLEADPDIINIIKKFTKPENKRQLQRLLGMYNYVRQFCPHLSSMPAPLSERRGSTKHWKCTHLHNSSLEKVKALIMTNKVLKPSNSADSQRIYFVCYSSDTGIAG